MSEWKECELGEVINLKRGYDLPQARRKDGGVPIISSSGITDYHSDSMAKAPGVITGRYGTIGEVFFSTQDYWPLNTTLYVQDFKGNYPKFIYYLLQTFDYQKYSDKSAVPGINRNEVHKEVVRIPDVVGQEQIAEILSCLDDKIDLLHRQNKTLEQMAETLFRRWFEEEADVIWELQPLGKVFDIGIGRTPPRKEQHWFSTNPNDVKWVSIKDMGTSGVYINSTSEYLTQVAIDNFSVPIIPENTVILSFKMTIGRLAITTERMVSNEAIAHFRRKCNTALFPEFLYLFLRTFNWQQLGSTSSIVEAINSQMVKEIEIPIPSNEELIRLEKVVMPTFSKVRKNQSQIRTLTKLRDSLLPKLMNGEIIIR